MAITAVRNATSYDWRTWLVGIMRSFVSGGSAAMVSAIAAMGIAPGTFNLSGDLRNTVKLMVIMFLFQGGYRMFEFLSLHGAPDKLQQALSNAADQANKTVDAVQEAKASIAEKS